jgi:hypothetical protein
MKNGLERILSVHLPAGLPHAASRQEGVDAALCDPNRSADPNGSKLAALDEAMDRARTQPEVLGDLVDRKEGFDLGSITHG